MRTALLLSLAAALSAQPALRPRMAERGAEGLAQAAPMLMRLRMQHLQEDVGLPEPRARAIAERWARYDQDFMRTAREMGRVRGRFNEILRGPGSDEERSARLKPLLDQFLDLRRQQQDLKSRFEDEVRANLNPAQQVRLILLVDELQQKLREGIREAMRENRPNRRF